MNPKSKPGDTLPSARHPDLVDARATVPDSELGHETLPTTRPPDSGGHTDPTTLRVCEPCDGQGCPWCHNGLQSREQYRMWGAFRTRMRNISNTYSFVESIVLDILDRLNAIDSDEALVLALEGQRLFEKWCRANPVNRGREKATEDLKAFNKKALDFLQR